MKTFMRLRARTAWMLAVLPVVALHSDAEAAACDDLLSREFFAGASVEQVESRLETCEVMARDDRGWTPLHHAAAASGDPSVLRLLIAKGADMDATTLDDPETRDVIEHLKPLHVAAAFSTAPGILTVLINRGGDVDARLPGDQCWFGAGSGNVHRQRSTWRPAGRTGSKFSRRCLPRGRTRT